MSCSHCFPNMGPGREIAPEDCVIMNNGLMEMPEDLLKPFYGATQRNVGNITTRRFTFRDLASATKNLQSEWLLGEGGLGRVYEGCLEKVGQIVAVKQLDRIGFQDNNEIIVDVHMLSLLHHQNLVKCIGYCADGEQRLLVYEFMPMAP